MWLIAYLSITPEIGANPNHLKRFFVSLIPKWQCQPIKPNQASPMGGPKSASTTKCVLLIVIVVVRGPLLRSAAVIIMRWLADHRIGNGPRSLSVSDRSIGRPAIIVVAHLALPRLQLESIGWRWPMDACGKNFETFWCSYCAVQNLDSDCGESPRRTGPLPAKWWSVWLCVLCEVSSSNT